MNRIRLDKNYNIEVRSQDPYTDKIHTLVEDILLAQEKKEISEKDAALLLSIAFRIEMKNDIDSWFKPFSRIREKPETYTDTILMQLNTTNLKHA